MLRGDNQVDIIYLVSTIDGITEQDAMTNAITIKSYRVTLNGQTIRVQAQRAQDALNIVAGMFYSSAWRQTGPLKKGRATLRVQPRVERAANYALRAWRRALLRWGIETQGRVGSVRIPGQTVAVRVVRLVAKQPMGAPVRDPQPSPVAVPMTVGAIFTRLAAEEKAERELKAEIARYRAENAALKGEALKPAAKVAKADDAALLAEIARYRAENAALKRKPTPKPAAKVAKADDAALLAEIARYRAENAALKAGMVVNTFNRLARSGELDQARFAAAA
jgi:hypothetical protein